MLLSPMPQLITISSNSYLIILYVSKRIYISSYKPKEIFFFDLMEEAANHVKNDMSKIGHEQPLKKAEQREIGFLIYILCKRRLYIASNHMSPETEFLFTSYGLESTKRKYYNALCIYLFNSKGSHTFVSKC